MAQSLRTKKAFTLVELLVVIGIIALLISILLPALSKARKSAQDVKCMANMKQIMMATMMYANDNRQFLPYTGWGDTLASATGRQWPTIGVVNWAYDGSATKAANTFKVDHLKTGVLWPYCGGKVELFRCPSDAGPWIANQYTQMTSYCANGCMGGWAGRTGSETANKKIGRFKPYAAMYFEIFATAGGGEGNDASDTPNQPVSVRHNGKSTVIGYIDGHVGFLNKDVYQDWINKAGGDGSENPLWCLPQPEGNSDGGWGNTVNNMVFQET